MPPPSSLASATALRTTRVDDLLERGGLRSQWLRRAELTGGVRRRDARLDHLVDAVGRRQLPGVPALRHQQPCRFFHFQRLLQHGHDHRGLWYQWWLELRLQVPPPSSLASTLASSAATLAAAAAVAAVGAPRVLRRVPIGHVQLRGAKLRPGWYAPDPHVPR